MNYQYPPSPSLPPAPAAAPPAPRRGLRGALVVLATLVLVLLVASTASAAISKARTNAYPRPLLGAISVGGDSSNVSVNQEVQFSVSVRAGHDLSYDWDFGDGDSSTSPSPIHTYSQFGETEVYVVVTDPLGQSAEQSLDVFVSS